MVRFSEDENSGINALLKLSEEPVRRRSQQVIPTDQSVQNTFRMVAGRRVEQQPIVRLADTRNNNREIPARTARRARSRSASDPPYIPPPSARRCKSGSSSPILRRSKRLRPSHVDVAEVDEPNRNSNSSNYIRTLSTTATGLEIAPQQSSEQVFKQAAMGFKRAAVELERAGGELQQATLRFFSEYFNQSPARLPEDHHVYTATFEILDLCRKGNKTTNKLYRDFSTYCIKYLM